MSKEFMDIIPVKDIFDTDGLPTTPHQMTTGRKLKVKHFRVFGCPAIFELGNTNTEPLLEKTNGSIGIDTSFPDNSGLPQPKVDALIDNPGEQDDIAFTTTEEEKCMAITKK